jgi:hypothetical protein
MIAQSKVKRLNELRDIHKFARLAAVALVEGHPDNFRELKEWREAIQAQKDAERESREILAKEGKLCQPSF